MYTPEEALVKLKQTDPGAQLHDVTPAGHPIIWYLSESSVHSKVHGEHGVKVLNYPLPKAISLLVLPLLEGDWITESLCNLSDQQIISLLVLGEEEELEDFADADLALAIRHLDDLMDLPTTYGEHFIQLLKRREKLSQHLEARTF